MGVCPYRSEPIADRLCAARIKEGGENPPFTATMPHLGHPLIGMVRVTLRIQYIDLLAVAYLASHP
jgi:hypothetical protein